MVDFKIAPSILAADFARLGEEVDTVLAAGADIVHFDVMDNHYVPNLTIGPMVCKALRNHGITAPIDVHLMVQPVDHMIEEFLAAGASYITFHPEASDHIDRSLQIIKDGGAKAGLVFNPATPLHYLDHVMDRLDMILLMSVNPGFGGQKFIPSTLDKLRLVRQRIDTSGLDIRLEVDGGVGVANIGEIARAGADTFVAGSAIFNTDNYQATIDLMRKELAASWLDLMISLFNTLGFEPKLVLFDLDGTLLDSLPDLYSASLSMANSLKITPPSLAQVEQWIGNGAAVLVQRVLANQFQPVAVDPRFDRALALFMDAYQHLASRQSRLYSGVEALLSELHQHQVMQGVITNKPSRFTEPLLSQFGILHYFDLVYSGDRFTEKKPHPMPLLKAAQQMGLSLEECLMVGDSSNDINAAKACGMPCLGVRGGYNHGRDVAECQPDWVVDHL